VSQYLRDEGVDGFLVRVKSETMGGYPLVIKHGNKKAPIYTFCFPSNTIYLRISSDSFDYQMATRNKNCKGCTTWLIEGKALGFRIVPPDF
jgi:hypothetical protein